MGTWYGRPEFIMNFIKDHPTKPSSKYTVYWPRRSVLSRTLKGRQGREATAGALAPNSARVLAEKTEEGKARRRAQGSVQR